MKKILAAVISALVCIAATGLPAGAATPPTYGDALDCLFGGLTNGPDSDPDMVAALMLTFDATLLEAAGDYVGAMALLEDAFAVLEDAEDTTPIDCTGPLATTGAELAGYTIDLWAEAGAGAKDLKHVAKHMAKGDKLLAKGKADKALKQYKKALKHAAEGLEDLGA